MLSVEWCVLALGDRLEKLEPCPEGHAPRPHLRVSVECGLASFVFCVRGVGCSVQGAGCSV